MQPELDILKELGNIAAGHGGTALSEILKKKINLRVPVVDVITCESLSKTKLEGENVMVIFSKILTGLKGEVIFFLKEKEAFRLIDLSARAREALLGKKTYVFTEAGISLIKEIGSVAINSYLSTLGLFLKRVIVPSFPILLSGSVDEILGITLSFYKKEEDYVYLIETIFKVEDEEENGSFYFILPPQTANSLTQACKEI